MHRALHVLDAPAYIALGNQLLLAVASVKSMAVYMEDS